MAEGRQKRALNALDVQVGRRIRQRRKQLGISQTALAASIGVSYQQLQKYERGHNQVAASRLAAIASVLDVSPAHFFSAEDRDDASRPLELVSTWLAAAEAAGEAASELVRAARERRGVPIDSLLLRLLQAVCVVAESEARPEDSELLIAIHRWKAIAPRRTPPLRP